MIKADATLGEIPIIALTASGLREGEAQVRSVCDDFLRKPVGKVELIRSLARFLAHTVSPVAADTEEEITPKAPDVSQSSDLQLLLELMQSHLQASKALIEVPMVDEIELFAQQMQKLGQEYSYPPLTAWTNRLMSQIALLDIEKLPETLEEFESLIQELRREN